EPLEVSRCGLQVASCIVELCQPEEGVVRPAGVGIFDGDPLQVTTYVLWVSSYHRARVESLRIEGIGRTGGIHHALDDASGRVSQALLGQPNALRQTGIGLTRKQTRPTSREKRNR